MGDKKSRTRANTKLTGDLGEILCAKFLPKIFG